MDAFRQPPPVAWKSLKVAVFAASLWPFGSLAAGAFGLATSRGPNHEDAFGDPVPSRFADEAELLDFLEGYEASEDNSFEITIDMT